MAVSVIDRLIEIEHCPLITADTVDLFLDGSGMAVLFFTGDPKQRPESNDVAVVLRELASVFPGELRIGIVDQAHEAALKARFGVLVVPTLVYLREGRFVGLIPRIQDWLAYVEKTRAFLAAPAPA
ncbi:hydrogenase [Skermanella stibiiresistens SB22]|uniref:Hydrogenase n=1 Tax=Skermanella stibiiresistens SB22 TaxID=1385369 RepID=W9GZX9_9PROT|nr:hypothetical protein [Skermanella stibiiresistens]EWY38116.1 hydrogenase [Skermanella stibiiresistens SB22]